jgi:hypothetical protein
MNVTTEPPGSKLRAASGRYGTAWATHGQIIAALGDPTYRDDCDRVSVGWVLRVPSGVAELRDYCGSGERGEWSIDASSLDAFGEFLEHISRLGIEAHIGVACQRGGM